MKTIKISTLTSSVVLLLAAGLLSGCGSEAEDAADQSNEVMGAATQNIEEYVEPVLNIDEYGRISSVDEVDDMGGMADGMASIGDGISDMMDRVLDSTDDAVDVGMETLDSMLDIAEDEIDGVQDMMVDVQEDVMAAAKIMDITSAVDEAQEAQESQLATLVDDAAEVVAATPENIRNVQQGLVNAGFNPGPVDGFSGPRTTIALERFQQQNDLAVGQLTKETLRALGVGF